MIDIRNMFEYFLIHFEGILGTEIDQKSNTHRSWKQWAPREAQTWGRNNLERNQPPEPIPWRRVGKVQPPSLDKGISVFSWFNWGSTRSRARDLGGFQIISRTQVSGHFLFEQNKVCSLSNSKMVELLFWAVSLQTVRTGSKQKSGRGEGSGANWNWVTSCYR